MLRTFAFGSVKSNIYRSIPPKPLWASEEKINFPSSEIKGNDSRPSVFTIVPIFSGSPYVPSSCKSTRQISISPTVPGISEAKYKVFPSGVTAGRSEEHTSELQSRPHLVCRLLLEKKK